MVLYPGMKVFFFLKKYFRFVWFNIIYSAVKKKMFANLHCVLFLLFCHAFSVPDNLQ